MATFCRGDRVALDWYEDNYTTAGDESVKQKRKFIDKAQPVKADATGELAKRIKLEGKYYDDNLSGTSKDNLAETLMYFLASTEEPRVRSVIDNHVVKSVKYTVQQTEVNDKKTL